MALNAVVATTTAAADVRRIISLAPSVTETIFALGAELRDVLSRRSQALRSVLRLGITDSLPKLLTARVLAPVLDRHGERLELTCVEGAAAELFGRLAAFQIDAVLAEMPVPPHLTRTMRARRLLDSGVTFLATPGLRKKLGPRFPASLDGARFGTAKELARVGADLILDSTAELANVLGLYLFPQCYLHV